MEKKHLPVLIGLFLCISVSAHAQNYFAARDLFNNIACNVICVIEYIVLAVCAVTFVLSGARYMASDEPSVRGEMRKNFKYAVVGLFLVFAGIPALNAFVNQTRSPFYCIYCSPDSYLFKIFAETLSCHVICLVQYISGLLLALILVFAGLRYIISGEDPKARHEMRTLIKNAFIGIIIVILAVPVLNYITDGTVAPFECECSSSGGDIIVSVQGLNAGTDAGTAGEYEETGITSTPL